MIFIFFSSVFFFFLGRTNLKLIEKQKKALGGPRACSFGKFLKI